MSAVFENVPRDLVIGFDQAMDENPLIDPTRWVVQTGTGNRFGVTVLWVDATTLRMNTDPQMGPSTPIEGIYSGQFAFNPVQSLASQLLADQVFPVVIV